AATYAIYRDYIRTLLATVSTRFMSTTEVAKPLTTARDELDAVIAAMRRHDFRMHLPEAKRLRRGIQSALNHYAG
uniref:hypothetical protein n=1 Tax=Stenotrophomonas maltophilia TaxID=40324 RepID=UPI0013D9469E